MPTSHLKLAPLSMNALRISRVNPILNSDTKQRSHDQLIVLVQHHLHSTETQEPLPEDDASSPNG